MRRFLLSFLVFALTLCTCGALASCDGNDKQPVATQNRVYYEYFDTVCVIYNYSGDESFDQRCDGIEQILKTYHELLDLYHEYDGVTNLATLNRTAGRGAVAVSRELADFLIYARSVYELTGGEVNAAMGSVLSIWHNYRAAGVAIPSKAELSEAAKHIDFDDVIVDTTSLTVTITDEHLSLDGGALAKGYVAARLREYLESRGAESYVLDLGGNLCAVGTKPDGSGWTTGVKAPDGFSGYVYKFVLSDASAVTSGSYERYYVVDGSSYHHIIDKDTLMPAKGFTSVTIVTPDDDLADALSTALFCMSYEQGGALLSTLDGASAVWVTENREVLKYNFE